MLDNSVKVVREVITAAIRPLWFSRFSFLWIVHNQDGIKTFLRSLYGLPVFVIVKVVINPQSVSDLMGKSYACFCNRKRPVAPFIHSCDGSGHFASTDAPWYCNTVLVTVRVGLEVDNCYTFIFGQVDKARHGLIFTGKPFDTITTGIQLRIRIKESGVLVNDVDMGWMHRVMP